MSFIATIAGQSFTLPTEGDEGWGPQTSEWMAAVSTDLLQRTGGNFTLTADVNFGANFATVQQYLKSRTANISATGFIRLARTDVVSWRNAANNADLALGVNGSNILTFDGNPIISPSGGVVPVANGGTGISSYTVGDILYATGSTTLAKLTIGANQTVMLSSGTAPTWGLLTTSSIASNANIAFSKLANLTSAHILVGNVSNVATDVAVSGDISLDNAGVTAYAGTVPIAKGGTGQTTPNPAFNALAPTTTQGDLIFRNATVNARLPVGAAGTTLTSNGTTVSWGGYAPMTLQGFGVDGTFTVPANVTAVKVTVIAGGGGGGGRQTNGGGAASCAGGGGAGGVAIKWVTGLTPAATVAVTVGAGGAGGVAGANNGSSGGSSSFGAHCSATGGAGGTGGASASGYLVSAGGAGGTGASGDLNLFGSYGGNGFVAAGNNAQSGYGAASAFYGATQAVMGNDGLNFGGGGAGAAAGASTSQAAGGAGTSGLVLVEWIAV